jgi:hypothetical protein
VSYTPPVAAPRKRPGLVTAAAGLLFLIAVLLVVDAVVTLSTVNTVYEATKKAYAGLPNLDQLATGTRIGGIAFSVIYLLFAVGFVVLALLNLRGANPARIVTWVLTGLGVLCFGCLLGLAGVGSSFGGMGSNANTNGVDVKAAARQVQDALPSWVQPVQLTSQVLTVLSAILVIILLALPAANAFFRKPPEDVVVNDPAFPQHPYPPAQ